MPKNSCLCKCFLFVSVELTYFLTYLFNPWNTVLFEKLTGSQLVRKLPAFYETRIYKCQSTVPILSQIIQAMPSPTSHFLKIDLNIIFPRERRIPIYYDIRCHSLE